MEDDVKKVSENCAVNSSLLLTDWLFKYKLDNISYLSAPQSIHAHISKNSRKGGIFDSRDIIRPTVQLFKTIRNQNKRRNETPSPQRPKPKANPIPSPTKESNRIFNHKGVGEDALEIYRKIYTYGKVKQDKVSRDKIESAVALYRQRELEKENSANRPPPEKNKRGEIKEVFHSGSKPRRGAKVVLKPTTKESTKSHKTTSKIEEKPKESLDIKDNNVPKEREGTTQSEDNKKNDDIKNNENSNKKIKINSNKKIGSKETKNINETKENDNKNKKGSSAEEEAENKQIKNNIEDGSKLKLNKELKSSKSVQRINDLNSEKEAEQSQINVINFMDNFEIKSQSRASLIKSLKSRYNQREIKSSSEVSSRKPSMQVDKEELLNRKIPTSDFMVITPAFINNEMINIQAGIKPKAKKNVDDLLREYRIKYRNMIKLR